MNEKQVEDIKKFCTNEVKFCIFQIDPTFNLGEFSVTTTQYEHLFLVNRISDQPPVMAGPIMIHLKKERITYRAFINFIVSLKPKLRSIRVFGTDSKVNLYNAFKDEYPNAHHLLCSIHFKNNIKHHLHKTGVDEANVRLILSDLFGEQIGTRFEEGIVDAENEVDFEERLGSLCDIWEYRLGGKGLELYNWFLKYKEEKMKKCMIKLVRAASGMGSSRKQFVTNRGECLNSLLKREAGKNVPVDQLVESIQELVERQQRNVEWALLDKGPLKLHISMQYFAIQEDHWYPMLPEDHKRHMAKFKSSDILDTILSVKERNLETTKVTDGLSLLANAN